MSSTGGINRQAQTDPNPLDDLDRIGLDEHYLGEETTLSPEEEARLIKKKDELNQLLLRMSSGNSGRAKIEQELKNIEDQLSSTEEIGSNWGEEGKNADSEGPAPINTKHPEDTAPTSIDPKTKTAIYSDKPSSTASTTSATKDETADTEEETDEPDGYAVVLHSNPGNTLANNYLIDPTNPTTVSIGLESKNDTAKVELVDGQYVITVKNLKGQVETYKIKAENVTKIQIIDTLEDKIDLSALSMSQNAKIQINDKDPQWLQGLSENVPSRDITNLEQATSLVKKTIEAGQSGDWEAVKDFLTKDPSMKSGQSAGNVLRKFLSTIIENSLSKVVDQVEPFIAKYVSGKFENWSGLGINPRDDTNELKTFSLMCQIVTLGAVPIPIGSGQGSEVVKANLGVDWDDHYNGDLDTRRKIGDNVQLVKREAIRFRLDKISADLKTEITELLKCIPKDVRQLISEKLPSDDECHMGDRFSDNEWRSLVEASLAE